MAKWDCFAAIIFALCLSAVRAQSLSQAQACEGQSTSLTCSSGTVINIVSAFWGRSAGTLCAISSTNVTQNCGGFNMLNITEDTCTNKTSCTLYATAAFMQSEPCANKDSYLVVTWICTIPTTTTSTTTMEPSTTKVPSTTPATTPPTTTTSTTTTKPSTTKVPTTTSQADICNIAGSRITKCESRTVTITCPVGQVINIVSAMYGRQSTKCCIDNNMSNTSCIATESTSIVKDSCEGENTCSVEASSSVFLGDPCYLTSKYLTVDYTCVDAPTTTTPTPTPTPTPTSTPTPTPTPTTTVTTTTTTTTTTPTPTPTTTVTTTTVPPTPSTEQCYGSTSGIINIDTSSEIKSALQCEDTTLNIDCGSNVITVLGAMYGRQSALCCSSSASSNTSCSYPSSTSTLQKLCNGLNKCSIIVNNAQLGGDPCAGTSKYLSVLYVCEAETTPVITTSTTTKKPTTTTKQPTTTKCPTTTTTTTVKPSTIPPGYSTATICENYSLSIACNYDQVPYFLQATYGRSTGTICPSITASQLKNTNCSLNVVPILQQRCPFSVCFVQAADLIYGDPCTDTYKYLQLAYKCVAKNTLPALPTQTDVSVAKACLNDQLYIQCPTGYKVQIISANYGRTSSNVCTAAVSNLSTNSTCINDVTSIVAKQCSSYSCLFSVSSYYFGTPCASTYKYLEVNYRCAV